MAKYATRRSYKNRASKKRRTIRKLKRTMRRKMQRGGGPAEDVIIKLMLQLAPQVIPIILSLIKLGNVELLISIIKLLSGNKPSIGPGGTVRSGLSGGSKSNNRHLQRGGGLKEIVLGKLDGIAGNFTDKQVLDCIGKIKDRINEQPEPAAVAPAAVDSSTELESLTTELTTDTEITQADKDIVTTQDPALEALVEKDESVTSNIPVNASLPPAVKEAAKTSIINKMITFFNERIKSKITAKLDGMISNLRGKVGEDVIPCIQTLKTAIVEDIVTQIKSNVSKISSKILSGIGGVAGGVFQFLVWSAVQMAHGNYNAILTEGGNQITQLIGAGFEKGRELLNAGHERVSGMIDNIRKYKYRGNTSTPELPNSESQPLSQSQSQPSQPSQSAPEAQKKPGLLGRIGSGIGSGIGSVFGRK
jgi:hypothetical protein